MIDAILPPMEDMNKQMQQAALKAVGQYIQQKQQQAMQAQAQGIQAPPFDAKELMGVVQQLQAAIAAPPEKMIKKVPQTKWVEQKKPRKQGAK
jgi:hypothetical protein